MQTLAAQLYVLFQPALLAALALAAAAVTKFIMARAKNMYVQGFLMRAEDVVFTLVKEANQVAVNDIKANGSSAEALAKVKADVLAKAKTYVSLLTLTKVLGLDPASQLDQASAAGWLSAKVEAAVHDIKATANPQPAPAG